MKLIKKGEPGPQYIQITTIKCFKCNSIIEATEDDFYHQDYCIFPIGGSWHLHCPVCGQKHYLYGSYDGGNPRKWELVIKE